MRLFAAICLPPEIKKRLFSLSKKITRGLDVKLVEEENLHLTLLFLGNIAKEDLGKVKKAISAAKTGNINLTLSTAVPFPNKKNPRMVWVLLEGQTRKLFSLYKQIVDNLLKEGIYFKDERLEFRPHVSLARLRSGGIRSMEDIIINEEFTARKFSLFESKLTPKGPKYLKLADFELK